MAKKQISILVDEEVLMMVDIEAERLGHSRNWVINKRLGYFIHAEFDPAFEITRSPKKIAEVLVPGGGAESGGTPDLSRLGKAQDGELGKLMDGYLHRAAALMEAVEKSSSVIYGRSGVAPDFNEVHVPVQAHEIQLKARSQGISTEALRTAKLSDGVPCGHAGCLSHVSHPCDGCGRIGGHRPIYNMEDNEAAQKNRGKSVPPEGLMEVFISPVNPNVGISIAPEDLRNMIEIAKRDGAAAKTLYLAGVELDREILVRWGLAENYKPKMEDVSGSEKSVEKSVGRQKGTEAGQGRRASKGVAKNNYGDEGAAVGVGKPGIDMKALQAICEGNIPNLVGKTLTKEDVDAPEFGVVDLCGFKSYNEIDGENYVCGKEVHDSKVKHGDWIKV